MIFASSLAAFKKEPFVIFPDGSILVGAIRQMIGTVLISRADSLALAEAEAHLFALERWPETEGWIGHWEETLMVPEEWIRNSTPSVTDAEE